MASQKDVLDWIEQKNKGTTTESHKIRYATNKIRALYSTLKTGIGHVRIDTDEGPVYVSKNAFNYLSETEKKNEAHSPTELLILRIITEEKLSSLAETQAHIPTTPEEYDAFRKMLHCFNLELPNKIQGTVTLDDISRSSQEKTSLTMGSSTPEFITRILDRIHNKPIQKLQEMNKDVSISVKEMHEKLHAFETSPHREVIQSVVKALRTLPKEPDALLLRKWVKKVSNHLVDNPKEKLEIFRTLLFEYEKQCAEDQPDSDYPFQAFAEAVFDEFFGTKELTSHKYSHLTDILSIMHIYSEDPERLIPILSPFMKEAILFYCLLHANQPIKEGNLLAQELKTIDDAYHHEGEPPLWQKLHAAHSKFEGAH